MQDIALEPIDGGRLRMEGTVTTYRYLDPNELSAAQQTGSGR